MTVCANCEVTITDPTTEVVHGDLTFCCANCAEAMEHIAGGSDPKPLSQRAHARCSHCGTPIVDERTMERRADQVFCCRNCAEAVSLA
jgi:hypothetical protein